MFKRISTIEEAIRKIRQYVDGKDDDGDDLSFFGAVGMIFTLTARSTDDYHDWEKQNEDFVAITHLAMDIEDYITQLDVASDEYQDSDPYGWDEEKWRQHPEWLEIIERLERLEARYHTRSK